MNFRKSFLILGSLLVLLASCSKEPVTGVEDGNYSGAKLVSFNNYGGYLKYNATIANKLDTVSFQLKLSNTMGAAESPIRVTLVRDNSLVSEYNTNSGSSLVPVPVNNIFLLDSVVTFQAGQRTTTFKVVFNSTRLGGGTALGVGIAKVEGDGATVIGDINQNRVVIDISALNKYDGVYTVSGTFIDTLNPTAFTSALPNEVQLITIDAVSVSVNRLVNGALIPAYTFVNAGSNTYYGNWGAVFSFDPSTDVLTSVTNYYGQGVLPQGRFGAIDPTGNASGNRFYSANHSIRAKYFMMQPNATTIRAKFNEIYTYVRPR